MGFLVVGHTHCSIDQVNNCIPKASVAWKDGREANFVKMVDVIAHILSYARHENIFTCILQYFSVLATYINSCAFIPTPDAMRYLLTVAHNQPAQRPDPLYVRRLEVFSYRSTRGSN